MLRKFLVGLFLVLLAGILWFVFAGIASVIFDTLYWCTMTCWYRSDELFAIAIVVPAALSLFFTRLAHISLISKMKAKNVLDEGNMHAIEHKKKNV